MENTTQEFTSTQTGAVPVPAPAPAVTTSDSIEAGKTITQTLPAPEPEVTALAEVRVASPVPLEGLVQVSVVEEVTMTLNGIAHRIRAGVSYVEEHVAEALKNIGKLL